MQATSSAYKLHKCQSQVFSSDSRFRVLVAGRRFGKTQLALVEMLHAAQQPHKLIWYIAPTETQARKIAWERLKALTQPFWRGRPNETHMCIRLSSGSTIVVQGAFYPDSLRGIGVDFLVIDEFAGIHPRAWVEVFRPALACRKGRALFIGTPQGRNHFYDLYEHALANEIDWAAFQFTTADGGIVDPDELAGAARDLDAETYSQEIQGQFTHIGLHRVYRAFTREENVRPLSFDSTRPLVWTLDFNVNPMCTLLLQKVDDVVHVLEEIVIKPSATTELACQTFLPRAQFYYNQVPYYQKPLTVKIYGDASASQRRTAASQTDWAIVKEFFRMWQGTFKPEYYTATANPLVRDRVNCVNSRLRNQVGENRLFIDPTCKELIRDLEEVSWNVDATGAAGSELNKSDRNRTHASDALGYFVSQAFPLLPSMGEKGSGNVLSF